MEESEFHPLDNLVLCSYPSCRKRKFGALPATAGSKWCLQHKCKFDGCLKTIQSLGLCQSHGGGKRCKEDNCTIAARGSSSRCTAHGGGHKCVVVDCGKNSVGGPVGGRRVCREHGGGRRCLYDGCNRPAGSRSDCCSMHGGQSSTCRIDNCSKTRQYAGLCVLHGGRKECIIEGCSKLKQSKKKGMCWSHFKKLKLDI